MTAEVLPLTAELMAKRLVVLAYTVTDEHGPIEEALFMSLRCDGCLAVVSLDDGFDVLHGWTTSGTLAGGWDDYCPPCSVERERQRRLPT